MIMTADQIHALHVKLAARLLQHIKDHPTPAQAEALHHLPDVDPTHQEAFKRYG